LISNFYPVLNVVFFLLDDSCASEFYMAPFPIFIGKISRKNNLIPVILPIYTAYEDGKE